jgi:alkanesulfonate monooxygenase SsuD/methylene tetrahydromethanopterin reductase-like flavin-dependent oxidoreductase (luciferase family)
MLRYAQSAKRRGFDSVWVPDHFFYEWPPGVASGVLPRLRHSPS